MIVTEDKGQLIVTVLIWDGRWA